MISSTWVAICLWLVVCNFVWPMQSGQGIKRAKALTWVFRRDGAFVRDVVFLALFAATVVACGKPSPSSDVPPPEPECTPAPQDLPFDYVVLRDTDGTPQHVALETPGGLVRLFMGPWGGHMTKLYGDPKSNMVAPIGLDESGSIEVEIGGNGDGICDPTAETCGLSVQTLQNRIPRYVAPRSGLTVNRIVLEGVLAPDEGGYWGTRNKWRVEGENCGHRYTFGHLGWIADDLRAKMLAAGSLDPESYSGETWVDLNSSPIYMEEGEELGLPQIWGYDSSPGFVIGAAAQMEFFTGPNDINVTEPVFRWLPTDTQNDLRAVVENEIREDLGGGYAYHDSIGLRWLWSAEADLWTAERADLGDYSTIFGTLGNWFEAGSDRDEQISIWPILRDTAFYDPGLYDSPDVTTLIARQKPDAGGVRRTAGGEVISPSNIDPIHGQLFVKWRVSHEVWPFEPTFQKISYSLDTEAQILRVHFGEERTLRWTAENDPYPSDPRSLECDGVAIVCMNHEL